MQSLRGFRDFFPDQMAQRSHLFENWRRVARRFGFVEYDGPPLELLELYSKKSGTEIVGQLYNFQDKGGRDVALRPEMTPTLARMMAARASSMPKPIKWFSIPQLFRYEKSQRGRLREHFQLNVDIIGAPDVEADAELLNVALSVLLELGLKDDDVVARVNDRRLVAGALELLDVAPEQLDAVYAAIDKYRKIPEATLAELLAQASVPQPSVAEILSLCRGDVPILQWFGSRLPSGDREPLRRAVEEFEQYFASLAERGLDHLVQVDFSIVRGLDYYTGIVFELYDRKGKERAICGGGRYDNLVALLGGPQLPALGFGMGDVVLGLMLEDRKLIPPTPPRVDAVVIPVGVDQRSAAREVTRALRAAGLRAETPFVPAAVGKELRSANQAQIPYAVIVGADEWADRSVNLKNLTTGEQATVSITELPDRVRNGDGG